MLTNDMLKTARLLIIVIALFGSLAAQKPQEGGALGKQVLWDFRTGEAKSQKVSKAETRAVFKYLFGGKWDLDLDVTSKVSGSFTKANAKQTLYYVGGCDEKDGEGFKSTTNCAHAAWWNAGKVAIYEGTTPILKIDAALGYEIAKVTDANGDGIDEILSVFGFSNQGSTETSAVIGRISNGRYIEIKSFDNAASDTCGNEPGYMKRTAKAVVVTYVPTKGAKMPDFLQEYYQNRCDETPWKKITKKQFYAD